MACSQVKMAEIYFTEDNTYFLCYESSCYEYFQSIDFLDVQINDVTRFN